MATLTVQQVTLAGVVPTTASAAGGGDKFAPGDNTWFEITNGGGGSITVTFDNVTPSNYGSDDNVAVAVAAAATKRFGPFNPNRWAAAADGLVAVTCSGVTTVTVAVWRV